MNEKVNIKAFNQVTSFEDIRIEYFNLWSGGEPTGSFVAVINLGDGQFLEIENIEENSLTSVHFEFSTNDAPTAIQLDNVTIDENVNGFLYNPGDVTNLASLLQKLIDSEDLRLNFSTKASNARIVTKPHLSVLLVFCRLFVIALSSLCHRLDTFKPL